MRGREKGSGWRQMRGGDREEVKGKAGTRFSYPGGHSGEESGLYPSVMTSSGRSGRAET